MEPFDLSAFVSQPSIGYLRSHTIRKEDWLSIAREYEFVRDVKKTWRKSQVKHFVISKLVDNDILTEEAFDLCDETSSVLEVKRLELQYAEREREKDRIERSEREERDRKERLEREEREYKFKLEQLKIERETGGVARLEDSNTNVIKYSKMIPSFDENSPDEFFALFEKLANSLELPKVIWPILIQPALKGKGRSAFLALTLEEGKDYDFIKESILRVYELTPEYYRLKFRKYCKFDNQSYVEYSHNIVRMHDKWLKSAGVSNMDEYRELILVEQFIRGIPIDTQRYLFEKEVTTLQRATVLAENFRLLRPRYSGNQSRKTPGKSPQNSPPTSPYRLSVKSLGSGASSSVTCYSCGEVGHVKARCPKHSRKNERKSKAEESNFSCCDINAESAGGVDGFKPFCFDGVLGTGDEHSEGVVVKLMRDTGSSQSLVVRGAVPGLEDCLTNDKVIVRSIGGLTSLPRARVHLDCGIFKGNTIVGVVESLPIPGVDVLVGNDVAGNLVVPDPVVCDNPLEVSPVQQLEDVKPELFPSCVVERSRGLRGIVLTESVPSIDDQFNAVECGARSAVEDDKVRDGVRLDLGTDFDYSLYSLFNESVQPDIPTVVRENSFDTTSRKGYNGKVGNVLTSCNDVYKINVTDLKHEQINDVSLQPLFKNALTEKESMAESTCYYLKAGVLMRKYRGSTAAATASWEVKQQLVVPASLKNHVMKVAHEVSTTHLGIKKTAYSTLQYFYWPSLLRDVKVFCNCCVTCQKVGKPNQAPKPVPLVPQVVCNVPFEKVIIDCVGALPKTKRQHQYMLTIMCSSIRYPDAIPLRNITTKNLIPHLVKVFTQYGIPKVVQTDRGTNFTSKLFQDVMLAMGVHHSISTAYHP
ncbi:uncharacterized protein [Palaemon carinicauda]|uniref:uncharacterized protein n=1 Tax=Palaemon carinicauda TaxID=392227 RepID=UPI0035B60E96